MRYANEHKQQTRTRMIETAARVFRRDGIDAAGIACLMKEAGLTNGAFYAHFCSKEALVAEAIVSALALTRAALERAVEEAEAGHKLDALIDHYLDPRHVAHPEHGCAVAALGAELGRRPESTKRVVDAAIDELVATIAQALPSRGIGSLQQARGVFASLVGTVQLARNCSAAMVPDILAAGAQAVRAIGAASPSQGVCGNE